MRNLTPLFLLLLARLSLSGEGTEGLFYGQEKVQKAYFMVRRRYRRLILWSGEGTEGLFYGQEKVHKAYLLVRRRYRRLILWPGEDTESLFYGLEKVQKAYFLISKPVLSGTFTLIFFANRRTHLPKR